MKTRRVPYLQMSLERFTAATIALFSASEQAHCAVVVLIALSVRVTGSHSTFFNIHRSG